MTKATRVYVSMKVLVDAPGAFERAHVIGVLRAEIARMFRLGLAMRFLLLPGAFERRRLRLGQDEVLLR